MLFLNVLLVLAVFRRELIHYLLKFTLLFFLKLSGRCFEFPLGFLLGLLDLLFSALLVLLVKLLLLDLKILGQVLFEASNPCLVLVPHTLHFYEVLFVTALVFLHVLVGLFFPAAFQFFCLRVVGLTHFLSVFFELSL